MYSTAAAAVSERERLVLFHMAAKSWISVQFKLCLLPFAIIMHHTVHFMCVHRQRKWRLAGTGPEKFAKGAWPQYMNLNLLRYTVCATEAYEN